MGLFFLCIWVHVGCLGGGGGDFRAQLYFLQQNTTGFTSMGVGQ